MHSSLCLSMFLVADCKYVSLHSNLTAAASAHSLHTRPAACLREFTYPNQGSKHKRRQWMSLPFCGFYWCHVQHHKSAKKRGTVQSTCLIGLHPQDVELEKLCFRELMMEVVK